MSPRPGSIRYGTISSEALPRAETPTWTSITRFYVENNGDVARVGVNLLVHYLMHGLAEGRNARRAALLTRNGNVPGFGAIAKPLRRADLRTSSDSRGTRRIERTRTRVERDERRADAAKSARRPIHV